MDRELNRNLIFVITFEVSFACVSRVATAVYDNKINDMLAAATAATSNIRTSKISGVNSEGKRKLKRCVHILPVSYKIFLLFYSILLA